MEYEEFVVELRRGVRDRLYHLTARSSEGQVDAELVLTERLAAERPRVRRARDSSPRVTRDVIMPAAALPPREYGQVLFRALFHERVAEHFARTRGAARQRKKGVRICIHTSEPALVAMPWELLHSPEESWFLCQSRETPIVRRFSVAQPFESFECKLPLKVLLVLSNASDRPLDLQEEEKRIRQELRPLERERLVRIGCLVDPTCHQLSEMLGREEWNVLHYAGHGGYDAHTHEGQISLRDPDGAAVPLRAEDLALVLGPSSSVRLVVLNSCDGARAGDRSAASTASTLMESGTPAVVAMQHPIGDKAATLFAQAVYRGVARARSVDEAVTAARKTMYLDSSEEWATPVLYLRGSDATLFRVRPRPPWGRIAGASALLAIPGAIAASGWRPDFLRVDPASAAPAPTDIGEGAPPSPPRGTVLLSGSVAIPPRAASPLSSSAIMPLTIAPHGDIAVGKPPPDFTATATSGNRVHLNDLQGRPVVVFFFPKLGPDCYETCGFRSSFPALSQRNVFVVGISSANDDTLDGYAKRHDLPFPLVSDPSGHLASAFGVPVHDGRPEAQTFLIGGDGVVKKVYRAFDPKTHAHDVAVDVDAVR